MEHGVEASHFDSNEAYIVYHFCSCDVNWPHLNNDVLAELQICDNDRIF